MPGCASLDLPEREELPALRQDLVLRQVPQLAQAMVVNLPAAPLRRVSALCLHQ